MSLQRASTWNGWTEEELLIQHAGHLRGRALQEWNLLAKSEKSTCKDATRALNSRLEHGSKTLAAQDFRHLSQKEHESVSDFISRLEKTLQLAYGRDSMTIETRHTLLHSQLQEGLRQEIMSGPAVSGAETYQALCLAAKNEERRLMELRKRRLYHRSTMPPQLSIRKDGDTILKRSEQRSKPASNLKCYYCQKAGHYARDYRSKKEDESKSLASNRRWTEILPISRKPIENTIIDPLSLLDSSDSDVNVVRVNDRGSKPQFAEVLIQGVPATGVIDTGADITIIGGERFQKVAAAARLKKRDFKRADKIPRTYDQQTFILHGKMDLDISFGDKTMSTAVYVKMDANDQLLLSEGVCNQLGIVTYHHGVRPGNMQPTTPHATNNTEAIVPMVRVNLLQSVKLPPQSSTVVQVKVTETLGNSPLLLEESNEVRDEFGIRIEDALLQPTEDGVAHIAISNWSGFTQTIKGGANLGKAVGVTVVTPEGDLMKGIDKVLVKPPEEVEVQINRVSDRVIEKSRKTKLIEKINAPDLSGEDRKALYSFLLEHHQAFSLDPGERGETDLVQMEIDTGNSSPKKQALRRMPYAAHQEIARQIEEMQWNGVIQPSQSPWSSPVVLVKKKDGSQRFCVDYRELNSVTKVDMFPLPRIDDLLDQLGESRYFLTLDLASGFWQIPVHPNSREKTAFVTPNGLFEFRVMPFGLCNSPAVFQHLMQQVLMGLNPPEAPGFVSVYIDDVLVFSKTLQEHLSHLKLVIQRLQEVGLKLKPEKCKYACKQLEYLGHVISSSGLKPNHKLTAAVCDFPTPRNVKEVRRFLGLTSYYRKFIPGFARVAEPLHRLTRKDVEFSWTTD